MKALKSATNFVTDYLPQIFMGLILVAAFSLAQLPAEETAQTAPAERQLEVSTIAPL